MATHGKRPLADNKVFVHRSHHGGFVGDAAQKLQNGRWNGMWNVFAAGPKSVLAGMIYPPAIVLAPLASLPG